GALPIPPQRVAQIRLNDVQFKLEKDFIEECAEGYTLLHIPFFAHPPFKNPVFSMLLPNFRRRANEYTLLHIPL
ncbi:MAG: hypothetical protein LBO82_08950, partial [Synergistaceae bacterium]|nr:hypothetical protein [Synergistaceae bacterium]